MTGLLKWMRNHSFETYLIALFLVTAPPTLLYFAARSGLEWLIYILLGLVVLGNLIVLSVRGNG